MEKGDIVLVISHHFPLALATIDGAYNYMKNTQPELGVWFRHFREVKDVKYYADWKTNPKKWQMLKMTDTISPLNKNDTASFQLIEKWLGA